MPTNIKCPNCATVFDVENVLSADVEKKFKQQYEKQLQESLSQINNDKKKLEKDQEAFEEKRKKENELFQQKLQQEKLKIETDLQQQLRKTIAGDYENQLRLLQQSAQENEEKLKTARQKEFEFLKKEQELKNKEQELEILLQKKLLEERNILMQQIRKEETERNSVKETQFQLEKKEWEIQREQQKKLIDDLKRKHEQGSMQLQGEAQELLLEDLLKNCFTSDVLNEVPKGKKGADCLLIVRNKFGKECGKILFESKRTKDWGKDWINKLKQDKINCNADVAVLVSQVLPEKWQESYDCSEDIWICNFKDVKILAASLREGLINVYNTMIRQQGKGDKMQLLYNYMTSQEFVAQWRALREVFSNMKIMIAEERRVMERLWKNREKQLEKALLNSDHIMGSIEGIAGIATIDFHLLDNERINDNDEIEPGRMFIKD